MSFNNPPHLEKALLLQRLGDAHPGVICEALVSAAFHESDGRWVQDKCIEMLSHANDDVRGVAASCLGHVARLHGTVDKMRVVEALAALLTDSSIAGRVQDALDDVEQFS
jgi:hypothetical protein